MLILNLELHLQLVFFKYRERKLRLIFELDLMYDHLKVFPNYTSTTGKQLVLYREKKTLQNFLLSLLMGGRN